MTKKHFIELAAAIAAIEDTERRRTTAQMIADVCARTNPRFSYVTFYAACNVEA